MGVWKRIAIGTGISAAAVAGFFGIRKLTRYSKTMTDLQDNVESVVRAMIHSLTLGGLTIRIDANIKNPTEGTINLKFPYIEISYNDSVIGTSEVVNKDVTLPKYGEANFEAIMVNVPIFSGLGLGYAIVKSLMAKQSIPLLVKVRTVADLGWTTKTIDQTHKINLLPQTDASTSQV